MVPAAPLSGLPGGGYSSLSREPAASAGPSLAAAIARTFTLAIGVAVVAGLLDRGPLSASFAQHIRAEPLRFMLALWVVTTAAAFAVIVAVSIGRAGARMWAGNPRRRESEILEKLALHTALGNQAGDLAKLASRDPRGVERALSAFMPAIRGYQSDRLANLGVILGFGVRRSRYRPSDGVPRRARKLIRYAEIGGGTHHPMLHAALADANETVRVAAALALVRTGEDSALERVLAFAATQSPTVRALLAEELRAHLLELDPAALSELLDSGEPRRVAATLEMIVAWQRVFELPSLEKLLAGPDPAIRALAFRALPLIGGVPNAAAAVLPALSSPDAEVRAAAAFAAGRLKSGAAVQLLTAALHDPEPAVVTAAARALATFGSAGAAALEREVADGSPAADAAIEALESAAFTNFGDHQ